MEANSMGLKKLVSDFGRFLQHKRQHTACRIARNGKILPGLAVTEIAHQFGMQTDDWFQLERGHIEPLLPFLETKPKMLEFCKIYRYVFRGDISRSIGEIYHGYHAQKSKGGANEKTEITETTGV